MLPCVVYLHSNVAFCSAYHQAPPPPGFIPEPDEEDISRPARPPGKAPAPPLRPGEPFPARCMQDYKARNSKELSIAYNDEVLVRSNARRRNGSGRSQRQVMVAGPIAGHRR